MSIKVHFIHIHLYCLLKIFKISIKNEANASIKIASTSTFQLTPHTWPRHVNDIFVMREYSLVELKIFSIGNNTKFANEIKENDSFSFLDIMLKITNQPINSSVYRTSIFNQTTIPNKACSLFAYKIFYLLILYKMGFSRLY